jgi:hypothetical protein
MGVGQVPPSSGITPSWQLPPGNTGLYDFLSQMKELIAPLHAHPLTTTATTLEPLLGELLGNVGVTIDNNPSLRALITSINQGDEDGIKQNLQNLIADPRVSAALHQSINPSSWLPIVDNFLSNVQDTRAWELRNPPPPPFSRMQDQAISLDCAYRLCMVPMLQTLIGDNDPRGTCGDIKEAINGLVSRSNDPPPGTGNPLSDYYNLPPPYDPKYPPDYWEVNVATTFQSVIDAIKYHR